jgi:hypothetical protein
MGLGGRRRRAPRVHRQVFALLVGLVVLLGLIRVLGPLAMARREQEELTRLNLERATLIAEQKRLESYKRQLASEAGLEAAARREGYLREGERRLVFIPQVKPRPASPRPAPGRQPAAKASSH